MNISAPSPLTEIDKAIATHNPFEGHFVVKTKDLWRDDFFDVPSINAHVSNAVFEKLRKIDDPTSNFDAYGMLIQAPKGRGKTHLLSRIAHRLRNEGNGVFIYVSEYGDLSNIRYQFLQSLTSSLKKPGKTGFTLWQEFASYLVNSVLKTNVSVKQVVQHFPSILTRKPEKREQYVNRILQKHSDAVDNPYILRAILWSLSAAHAPYAINWLSGRGLTEKQAELMDLPDSIQDGQDAEAFDTTCQILKLLGKYCVPVICFDQLDGTELGHEDDPIVGGFTRGMAVASLATDLYDNIDRSMMLTALYAKTWQEEVSQTGEAVDDRIAQDILELHPLNSDTAVDLIRHVLQEFYRQHNLVPPHPLYPFDIENIKKLGKEKPTVREVMRWYADQWSEFGLPPVKPKKEKKLYNIYQSYLNNIEADFFDNNQRVADALVFGFSHLIGQTIENVTVEVIQRQINPKSANNGWLNFIVVGQEDGQTVKIAVAVLQNQHGKSVGAGLRRLTWHQKFGFTRGCLVRSKSIGSTFGVALQCKDKLINEQGGEWVSPKIEEVRSLVALKKLAKDLENEGFTQEEFEAFLTEQKLLSENPVLKEILSDPSGQNPDEVEDEDAAFDQAVSEQHAQLSVVPDESDDLELPEAS